METLRKLLNIFCLSKYEINSIKLSEITLNTIEFNKSSINNQLDNNNKPIRTTAVYLPGYGSGIGLYMLNYDDIIHNKAIDRIVAIDWPGLGFSQRKNISSNKSIKKRYFYHDIIDSCKSSSNNYSNYNYVPIQSNDQHDRSIDTISIDFFIDSIEEWRMNDDINNKSYTNKYIFIGHSLGGYLSCQYINKYPNNVDKLILLSPVGLQDKPKQEDQVKFFSFSLIKLWGIKSFLLLNIFRLLWACNITHQHVLQWLSYVNYSLPAVKSLIHLRLIKNKHEDWSNDRIDALVEYFHSITQQPIYGEYSLNTLLVPLLYINSSNKLKVNVFARQPISDDFFANVNIPVLLIYGDNDWMCYDGIESNIEKWNEIMKTNRTDISLDYIKISNAGHNLHIDNSEEVNRVINHWINK